MFKKIILLILHAFIFHFVKAQTIIPRFETLGVNDGLPHSSVYSILQDKEGFMWFGTPDGLCRYDGSRLISYKYNLESKNEEANNFVRGKILEDKSGNIWYSNQSGIYKWDKSQEKILIVFPFEKKLYRNSDFNSIELDNQDNIWMLNPLLGIVRYRIITKEIKIFPLPLSVGISSVQYMFSTLDNEGSMWLHAESAKIPFLKFNKKTFVFSTDFAADPPHAIFFENQTKVLSYNNRLVIFSRDKPMPIVVPKIINKKNVNFYSFSGITDAHNRLWLTARGNGLFYYNLKEGSFHEYHHDNSKLKSLPFDLTTCLYIDRNENLWIGMDGGGVARIDLKEPKFNLFPLSEGDYPILKDYFTKCFYEDTQGRIWFGSQTNGLNIFNPITQELINYHHETGNNNSLPGNMIGSIIKDRAGNMWIGSSGGISLFHEKNKNFKTIHIQNLPILNPLSGNFMYKMIQLEDGNFLAATLFGIIKVLKETNGNYSGIYFSNNPSLTSATTDIIEMSDKTIYATLPGLGLYQLRQSMTGYNLENTFFRGIDLRSVRKDENAAAYLWISSSIGLIYFNTKTHSYQIWNEKDGMSNSYVYGSLEDSAHNLWMSTNKGLTFFNRRINKFENYSFQDGLQSNEFNTQAHYKSATGVLYFGGIKGFNWFKPGYITKGYIKPVAAITRIEINDTPVQVNTRRFLHNTITVPYDKNDFNFQFAALDYTRPEANKVQYMLQGWDSYPVTTDIKSARYANLPPGNYVLKVKVLNAEGVWSNEEKLNIIIRSPFWKQIWFLSLIALLLLAAIVYTTYRVSQAKAKRKFRLLEKQIAVNAERIRISADMHDEIGSGITHIALLSELIQTQQKDSTELKKDIKTIAISAHRLVQTISEIIWALNPHNDTLENLLAYIREQSQQYFDPLDIKLEIYFPDDVPEIKLSNSGRRNIYLVTREAMNNAIKYSGATTIELRLTITKSNYCFSVTDNGKGMNEKIKVTGNGIKNMKKRMEDINGSIKWLALEKGTKVEYCMSK